MNWKLGVVIAAVVAITCTAAPAGAFVVNDRGMLRDQAGHASGCRIRVQEVTKDYRPLERYLEVRGALRCDDGGFSKGRVHLQAWGLGQRQGRWYEDIRGRFTLLARCNARPSRDTHWQHPVQLMTMHTNAVVLEDGTGTAFEKTLKSRLPYSC